MKAKTWMGEIHHRYVWYDGSSEQSGGGQASISQRHLGSDVLTRICSEKRDSVNTLEKSFFSGKSVYIYVILLIILPLRVTINMPNFLAFYILQIINVLHRIVSKQ